MAINISRIAINAPIGKVWQAITDPALVKLWQYGSKLLTSWEIGTAIQFETEWEGNVFKQWGTVLTVKPNELIRYSLFAPRPGLEDKAENYFIMNYVLTENDGQTILEIIQEDNRPNAVQEPEQGEENPILKTLKEIAETK